MTTDFVYLKFHGPEALYTSDYTEEKMAEYAGKIKSPIESGSDVWVFFNNDFNGYALKNAFTLRSLTEKSGQLA